MPIARDPRDAVVSVWDQASMGDGHIPIGSGVFISPQYVLTARHVVKNAVAKGLGVWLGNVRHSEHGLVHVTEIFPCPKARLDIALLKLDFVNTQQPWLWFDLQDQDLQGKKVALHGVLPQEKHSITRADCTILTRKNPLNFVLIDYAQAMGLSGGAVTFNRVIVGVICARYKEESLGCILPISAARAWLQDFPELQQFVPRPGSIVPPPGAYGANTLC